MSHGAQNTVQRNEERNRRVVTGKRTRHLADPDQELGPAGVTEGRGGHRVVAIKVVLQRQALGPKGPI